jgi:phosphatidylserine decarboxylase precursor
MDDYEDAFYDSFNEFFCRRIKAEKRPLDMNPQHFIAPCDGLLSVYKVTNGLVIPVKQSSYSIARLLRSRKLARKYEGGMCLVFRLCVDNYHRYCFPDNAVTGRPRHIRGILHTVRPVALYKEPVFTENTREYTLLRTENFGDIVQMEVGAMLIGKIDNYNTDRNVKRGAEKGRFLYDYVASDHPAVLLKGERMAVRTIASPKFSSVLVCAGGNPIITDAAQSYDKIKKGEMSVKRKPRPVPDEAYYPQAAHDACEQLRRARRDFENADDPRLVEAAVYRLRALELRYAYLLQKAGEVAR